MGNVVFQLKNMTANPKNQLIPCKKKFPKLV